MTMRVAMREFIGTHWKHLLRNLFMLAWTPFIYRGESREFGSVRIGAVLSSAWALLWLTGTVSGFALAKAKAGRLDSKRMSAHNTWMCACLSAGFAILFVVALPTRQWPVLAVLGCFAAIMVGVTIRSGLAYRTDPGRPLSEAELSVPPAFMRRVVVMGAAMGILAVVVFMLSDSGIIGGRLEQTLKWCVPAVIGGIMGLAIARQLRRQRHNDRR